jgi:CubicO group peptidase (beta-lactamase class C family)
MKFLLLMLLASGLALYSCAQKDMASKIQNIDYLLTRQEGMNKFNGTVLVAQKGQILLKKGYGYADFENKKSNDSSGIFQIYSITKTFTSSMVFILIEQGKLSLDDRLSKFYPSFPNGDNITIEHLLTHTSGINDTTDDPNAQETEAYRVERFGKNPVNFAPGEGWSYCNGGYQLLGYIIAKVTGMSYEEAVRKHIFNPLGMSASGFDFKNLPSPEKVSAYHIFTDDRKEKAVLYDSTGPYAAGSIYSTVGDLYKYYRGIRSSQLISKTSQDIAFSPSKTNKGYGYGWQLRQDSLKRKVISHSGGAAGFRSNFAMIPKDDICVIVLNNHENANTDFLTGRIIDILRGKDFEPISEVKLTDADLKKFVGAFSVQEPQMMIYTSIIDGRLAVEVSGQGKQTVLSTGETVFFHEEADAILEFASDENGIFSEFTITQGSRKMFAKRIESSWGLLGSATKKGWVDDLPDLKFSEDSVRKGLWVLKKIALKKGEIKFRLNNDWNINYGDTKGDGLLDMHGENIKIEAGVYDLILDLTDESNPRYNLLKTASVQ